MDIATQLREINKLKKDIKTILSSHGFVTNSLPFSAYTNTIYRLLSGKNELTYNSQKLFTNNEVGLILDPNDLSDEKINWRRNLLTETEFRNGLVDLQSKSGNISAATFSGLNTNTGIAFSAGVTTTGYKLFTPTVGVTYTFSCYIIMDDGSVPKAGLNSTDATGDFSPVMFGDNISSSVANFYITNITGSLYRVSCTVLATKTTDKFGIVKYASNSTKGFKVSGYQLEIASSASVYQPITDFNSDFIKEYPNHCLFQDAAGIIPVTSAGQPVGLSLDKSKGLVLGPELIPLPLDFNSWVKTAAVTSFTNNGFTTNGSGGCTLSIFGSNNTKTYRIQIKGTSTVSGNIRNGSPGSNAVAIPAGSFNITMNNPLFANVGSSVYIALGSAGTITIESISVKELAGNHAYQSASASRPILRQTPILGNEIWKDSSVTITGESQRISPGVYRIYSSAGATSGVTLGSLPTNTPRLIEFTIDSIANVGGGIAVESSVSQITHTTVGKKRVIVNSNYPNIFIKRLATCDYIISNVSAKPILGYRSDRNYFEFDGVDDFLQTNNIDFSFTDEMSVFTGVRKLSDASTGTVVELSLNVNSNNGSFFLGAPFLANTQNFGMLVRGGSAQTGKSFNDRLAPVSSVLGLRFSISKKIAELRESSRSTTSTTDLGATNLGNYPIYIGRRSGTTLAFNGYLYSLVLVGRLSSEIETTELEKIIGKQIGVML